MGQLEAENQRLKERLDRIKDWVWAEFKVTIPKYIWLGDEEEEEFLDDLVDPLVCLVNSEPAIREEPTDYLNVTTNVTTNVTPTPSVIANQLTCISNQIVKQNWPLQRPLRPVLRLPHPTPQQDEPSNHDLVDPEVSIPIIKEEPLVTTNVTLTPDLIHNIFTSISNQIEMGEPQTPLQPIHVLPQPTPQQGPSRPRTIIQQTRPPQPRLPQGPLRHPATGVQIRTIQITRTPFPPNPNKSVPTSVGIKRPSCHVPESKLTSTQSRPIQITKTPLPSKLNKSVTTSIGNKSPSCPLPKSKLTSSQSKPTQITRTTPNKSILPSEGFYPHKRLASLVPAPYWSCSHCGNDFKSQESLTFHLNQNSKIIPCSHKDCSQSLRPCNYKSHLKKFHTIGILVQGHFPCPTCKRIFPFKWQLSRHLARSHRKRPPQVKKVVQEADLKCQICQKKFEKKITLYYHLKENHRSDPPPFVCTFEGCTKSFYIKGRLKNHLKSHDKEASKREYEASRMPCHVCGEMVRRSQMKTHVKLKHDKPANFLCQVCGAAYPEYDMLRQHCGIHLNPKGKEYSAEFDRTCPQDIRVFLERTKANRARYMERKKQLKQLLKK